MTTFIDPDRIAAGHRAKIDAALDESEAMEDALGTVAGSVTAYENQFRRFLRTLVSVSETEGLTYEALAKALADDNEDAVADGVKPPHRFTSAGSLSTLEAVGQLDAMGGSLPEGYVWRRPSESAPLLKGERSVADLVWKIISPGTRQQELLREWAAASKTDISTLYGKRVVMGAIRSSIDLAEAVQKLNTLHEVLLAAAKNAQEAATKAARAAVSGSPAEAFESDLDLVQSTLERLQRRIVAGDLPSNTGIAARRLREMSIVAYEIAGSLSTP